VCNSVRGAGAVHTVGATGSAHAVEEVLKTAVTRLCLCRVKRQLYLREGPLGPPPGIWDKAASPCSFRCNPPKQIMPMLDRDIPLNASHRGS